MKKTLILFVLLGLTSARAQVTNPQTNYLSNYKAGDIVKKFVIDINGDGVLDSFFNTSSSTPDPIDVQAESQAGGALSWDAYVSQPNTSSFTVSNRLETEGEIIEGVGLELNPDQMFVGNVSEINRLAVVTSAVKRARAQNSIIIYAYTWEGNRFKQWKLAEYLADEANPIFDKYLEDDKRTHVNLQSISP